MRPRLAIVGGGLTGAAAAIALLRRVTRPFELVVTEPEADLGCGVAYGKAEPFHLLNVRAGKLGVIESLAGDFADWAGERLVRSRARDVPPDLSRAFLSRRQFGDYVQARLRSEIANRPDVILVHRRTLATAARRGLTGFEISLDRSPPINAQVLILASGYGRSAGVGRFGRNPFTDLDPEHARRARSALFVGTGMTFVDEFLRLRGLGFGGRATAISRHGLLPEVHRANEAPWSLDTAIGDPRLRWLLSVFRSATQESDPSGAAAVNLALGLREQLQILWQQLGTAEQKRFLRHLRTYWNVIRHRLPPEAYVPIRHAAESNELEIKAARVVDMNGGRVLLRSADGRSVEQDFDLVFDCTGHRPEIGSPLVRSLIGQGVACADPHDLGLSIERDGTAIDRLGRASRGLFALGPLGQGSLYEITAVPEIVAQCARMADVVETRLGEGAFHASWPELARAG